MNLTQTVFFDRAVEIGARLLTASVYANFYDSMYENEPGTDFPYARAGVDWCDCLPDWPDILLPASLEMAMFLQELCRATDEYGCAVPELLRAVYDRNGTLLPPVGLYEDGRVDWDRWLADIPVPDRGPTALEFLTHNLVFDALGTGCGIQDCGWKWPGSWLSIINYRFEGLDFESWFPDWEKRVEECV